MDKANILDLLSPDLDWADRSIANPLLLAMSMLGALSDLAPYNSLSIFI